jgi:NAD(P)H-dependent flavin oxidoreductase YrpB (nitropropane dioxygenase family)
VTPPAQRTLHTPLCDLAGVTHPIVQTGMGWVSSPELVVATARAGGLGILAAATMTPDEVESALRRIREQTDAPFGVGFLMGQPGQDRIVDLLVEHRVRVAGFNRNPQQDVVRRLQRGGVLCMPTVGAVKHARKVEQLGVDAVIVQGAEGGGHTGSIATSLLLPAVVDAVRIPVVAAGGYFDGRGLVAALAYGACGVAMGTRFLVTEESPVPMHVKQHYVAQPLESTVVTDHIDGFPQRVLRNPALERIERARGARRLAGSVRLSLAFRRITGMGPLGMARSGLGMRRAHGLSMAQTMMAANAPTLVRTALVEGDAERGIMPTGQVVGMIADVPPVAELIERIVAEAVAILDRLCGRDV